MARMVSGHASVPSLSRTRTQPIPTVRTRRGIDLRVLTSMPAGKMVPIAAFPLLREDSIGMSRMRLNFEMMETAELLMNAVNVNVKAYLVPNLAFERFNGIDQLNRSYMKQPETDGGAVVPFFTTSSQVPGPSPTENQVLYYMGMHTQAGQPYNFAYNEAYNEIWNFRATNRSPDIPKRLITDTSLADAFWQHQQFAHIVPDFDQALIDGEVPLNVTDAAVTLRGLYTSSGYNAQRGQVAFFRASDAATAVSISNTASQSAVVTNNTNPIASNNILNPFVVLPQIVGELAENGITVSLSNIEMARKTQAFAVLRKQYTGHSDDYIIDLLMQGITVPEQAWRQPILLADRSSIFGMAKRYASDSTDLTASVVNGASFIDLAITCPRCPTGGVVMIVAEVTPEQLFERQGDPYLFSFDQDTLPDFLRDTLDPEKVEVVPNAAIDVKHATPAGTFGYAPLNWKWNQGRPGIGGKFYRPAVDDPFDEDRMRLWSVETANPTLSQDFYLCHNIHQKVFVVTDQDPFECVCRGMVAIEGNTVFGHALIEASDDYQQVLDEADQDRIDKPATTEADADAAAEGATK